MPCLSSRAKLDPIISEDYLARKTIRSVEREWWVLKLHSRIDQPGHQLSGNGLLLTRKHLASPSGRNANILASSVTKCIDQNFVISLVFEEHIVYLAEILLSMQLKCKCLTPLLVPAAEATCESRAPLWKLNPVERIAHLELSISGMQLA